MALLENPRLATHLYRAARRTEFGKRSFELPEGARFPLIPLRELAEGAFRNRATIEGLVQDTVGSGDHDVHINLVDGFSTVVAEITPEIPMEAPPKGARIRVWGFVRHDDRHGWWEIHPVLGWSYADGRPGDTAKLNLPPKQ